MIVECHYGCGLRFNDEYRDTRCPHDGINGLCVKHDLYACPCKEKEPPRDAEALSPIGLD